MIQFFLRVFLCVSLLTVGTGVMAELQPGDLAPDFSLMASDGQVYTLSQFKGQKDVVIAFFPKAYTGGCTIECKALRDSDAEIQAFNIAYFMASVDAVEDNRGFAEQNKATFPILSDPDKTMSKSYGVLSALGFAKRWTYYIDKAGVVKMIDKDVTPKTAGVQLVKYLNTLSFGHAASD